MPGDSEFSSSGESGSDGSCGRSQEDTGSFVLQRRNLDTPTEHPEGNGMLATPHMASGHLVSEKSVYSAPSMSIGMEYWSSPLVSTGHEVLKPQCVVAPAMGTMANYNGPLSETKGSAHMWLQGDREQKREKRKQANRESARRSRMRKQFEYEELAEKVTSLTTENDSLKLEVNRLGDLYKKLASENNTLLQKPR